MHATHAFAYNRLWANCIPKNIVSFCIQNESLTNKLCFDIKRFVIATISQEIVNINIFSRLGESMEN